MKMMMKIIKLLSPLSDKSEDNDLGLVFEPRTKAGLIKYCKELKTKVDKYEEQEEINKQMQIEKNKELEENKKLFSTLSKESEKIKASYELLFKENERLKKELKELKKIKESQEKEIAELKAKAPKRGRPKKQLLKNQ